MTIRPTDLTPRPPAHVQAYVDLLGPELAITFLLTFGGAELYLAASPKGRSRLAEVIGIEAATDMARIAEQLPRRVPVAKPWIAQVWKSRGLSTAEIARRLHVTDVTVRGWLRRVQAVEPENTRQLRLF